MVRARAHTQKIGEQIELEKQKISSLRRRIARQETRLKDLEKPSLGRAFAQMTGQYSAKEEAERQAYYELVMKLKAAETFVENADFELQVLGDKLKGYEDTVKRLQELLSQREELLSTDYHQQAPALHRTIQLIDQQIGLQQEVIEAILVGELGLDQLQEGITTLKTLITKLTRGQFKSTTLLLNLGLADLQKIQKITAAIQLTLLHFEDEMLDIYRQIQLTEVLKIEQGSLFDQAYYKTFMQDGLLQLEGSDSLQFFEGIWENLDRKVSRLKKDRKEIEANIRVLTKARDDLMLKD